MMGGIGWPTAGFPKMCAVAHQPAANCFDKF